MIRRSTWIVLIILAGVLAIALYMRQFPASSDQDVQPTVTPQEAKPFLTIAPEEVVSLQVIDAAGESTTLERETTGNWLVAEMAGNQADVARIEGLVNQFVSADILAELQPAPELSAIGLEVPAYTIVINTSTGEEYDIKVGSETVTSSGYYLQVNQDDPVVVSNFVIEQVLDVIENPPLVATPAALETQPAP